MICKHLSYTKGNEGTTVIVEVSSQDLFSTWNKYFKSVGKRKTEKKRDREREIITEWAQSVLIF